MQTYFNCDLQVLDKGRMRSLVLFGKDTLTECHKTMLEDARYYLTECQYQAVHCNITENCKRCENEGTIRQYSKRVKFSYKLVKCPECKGKYPTFTESFDFTLNDIPESIV